MASAEKYISVRIMGNDYERKWDLHKGNYSLYATREQGLVLKGLRTEITISRKIIRQHGIGKISGPDKDQDFYFVQVGSKSPYGEGTINIFPTDELSRRGKAKKMSGTAFIGEWITERFYSNSSNPRNQSVELATPTNNPGQKKNLSPKDTFGEDKKKGDTKKWFEEDTVASEYEPDVWIPLRLDDEDLSDDDPNTTHVTVADTYDIYSVPGPKPDNVAETTSQGATGASNTPYVPPTSQGNQRKTSHGGKKNKQPAKVTVADTEDEYSLPDNYD